MIQRQLTQLAGDNNTIMNQNRGTMTALSDQVQLVNDKLERYSLWMIELKE